MKKQIIKRLAGAAGDLLLAAVLLLVFAYVHHGRQWLRQRESRGEASPAPSASTVLSPAPPSAAEEAGGTETKASEEDKTPWQLTFSEHFRDVPVQTENSYASPWVSVTVTEHCLESRGHTSVYYVADIYIGKIENFRSYLAGGQFALYATENMEEMSRSAGAVLAINGDFYGYQPGGVTVRDGVWYRDDFTGCDLCVLYRDGRLVTYGGNEAAAAALKEEDVWQIWCFGPELLDEEGRPLSGFNMSTAVSYANPRSALGYYEPGHYCFVVVDGRQEGYSYGVTMEELAQIFADLGCRSAYNLDGGGSAAMTFGGSFVSRQSNGGRELSDILLIGEAGEGEQEP